jgi:hypothetical protein
MLGTHLLTLADGCLHQRRYAFEQVFETKWQAHRTCRADTLFSRRQSIENKRVTLSYGI